MALGGNRHHRLYMRWYPGRSHTRHGDYILRGLVQARCWITHGRYHRQQERLGLRLRGIHHALDPQVRLRASDHDQCQLDHALVSVRNPILLLWQDVPKVVEEQLRP